MLIFFIPDNRSLITFNLIVYITLDYRDYFALPSDEYRFNLATLLIRLFTGRQQRVLPLQTFSSFLDKEISSRKSSILRRNSSNCSAVILSPAPNIIPHTAVSALPSSHTCWCPSSGRISCLSLLEKFDFPFFCIEKFRGMLKANSENWEC